MTARLLMIKIGFEVKKSRIPERRRWNRMECDGNYSVMEDPNIYLRFMNWQDNVMIQSSSLELRFQL